MKNSLFVEDSREKKELMLLYDAAILEIKVRLEVLNDEFKVKYARSPIHHIETRIKSEKSLEQKLRRKNLPLTVESIRQNINDVAGIRIVCGYIDDVYAVEQMLLRQSGIMLLKRQDYIEKPNYNGYRSLHLDMQVPIYLSQKTEYVNVEIQIRSVAMDFWASLEHDVRYKAEKSKLPIGINEEMLQCSDEIAKIDRKMQEMYKRIQESE